MRRHGVQHVRDYGVQAVHRHRVQAVHWQRVQLMHRHRVQAVYWYRVQAVHRHWVRLMHWQRVHDMREFAVRRRQLPELRSGKPVPVPGVQQRLPRDGCWWLPPDERRCRHALDGGGCGGCGVRRAGLRAVSL